MTKQRWALGALAVAGCLLLLFGPNVGSGVKAASGPCGTRSGGTPTITKVLWIWMENHDYSQIVGNTNASYENQLASSCGLATNYHGISHPSLPNYIAATSGSTQGISDDGSPSSHPLDVPSIFGQVGSRSYEETMPSNCYLRDSSNYVVHHNPEAYYTPIRSDCNVNDLPLGTSSSGKLVSDVNAGALRAFSFVTPNECNDMHDCSIGTGDAWVQRMVPIILAGPDYRSGHLAVFVTFDENTGSSGNHVYTAVISPYTSPGTQSSTTFDHYSLLRSAEELLGAQPLGHAATANSMLAAFNLGPRLPPRGKCVVPRVVGKRLATARNRLTASNCRTGRVGYRHSRVRRGLVYWQSRRPGARLSRGSRIRLLVSLGRR